MAKPEPICPPEVTSRLKALVSGGTNIESLERERSDSNGSGGQAAKEQGSNPNIRDDGGRRTRTQQTQGSKGDRELSIPSTSLPAIQPPEGSIRQAIAPEKPDNNPFLTGDHILKAIMDKFVELRENQKVGAWKQLQSDLMRAAPFIVPHIIPLKDVIQIAADIEKEIKGSTAQVGRSNEELLSDFLNGGDAIKIGLDRGSIVGERDEESATTSPASDVAGTSASTPHPD